MAAHATPIAAAAASCGALVAACIPVKPMIAPISDIKMVTTHMNLATCNLPLLFAKANALALDWATNVLIACTECQFDMTPRSIQPYAKSPARGWAR